jgi:hypothetical protein
MFTKNSPGYLFLTLDTSGMGHVKSAAGPFCFVHGRITLTGHPADDLAPGTLNRIFSTSKNKGMIPMHNLKKLEKTIFTYSPDLPGCIATGKTREEAKRMDA